MTVRNQYDFPLPSSRGGILPAPPRFQRVTKILDTTVPGFPTNDVLFNDSRGCVGISPGPLHTAGAMALFNNDLVASFGLYTNSQVGGTAPAVQQTIFDGKQYLPLLQRTTSLITLQHLNLISAGPVTGQAPVVYFGYLLQPTQPVIDIIFWQEEPTAHEVARLARQPYVADGAVFLGNTIYNFFPGSNRRRVELWLANISGNTMQGNIYLWKQVPRMGWFRTTNIYNLVVGATRTIIWDGAENAIPVASLTPDAITLEITGVPDVSGVRAICKAWD